MKDYWQTFLNGYTGYFNYLWHEITTPSFYNYFYALLFISALVYLLEWLKPWREKQAKFRKDFWLDFFYMFFNFFLFSLLIYNASSEVVVKLFSDVLASFGITNLVVLNMEKLPTWTVLLIGFIFRDFIQWNIHRLLHHVPWLWEFHKLHHSVKEMGFSAHLRYHWMETIVYRSIEYIPLALIGIGVYDFYYIHLFTILIGHLNHANLNINYGVFKYVLNSPQMHIWHHAKELPQDKPHGVNFGITLSIWDYLFGTNYLPSDGKEIPLGFDEDETYPQTFWKQITYGLQKKRKEKVRNQPKELEKQS